MPPHTNRHAALRSREATDGRAAGSRTPLSVRLRRFALQLWRFGWLEARACVFAGAIFFGLAVSAVVPLPINRGEDRKSTRLNSSHVKNSYADFGLKKKTRSKEAKEVNE